MLPDAWHKQGCSRCLASLSLEVAAAAATTHSRTPPGFLLSTGNIPQIYGPKGVWVMAEWANVYGPLYKVRAAG